MTTIISLIKQGVEHLRNISEDTRLIREHMVPNQTEVQAAPVAKSEQPCEPLPPINEPVAQEAVEQDTASSSRSQQILARFRQRVSS